jgi:Tfp pilus assembly protein PilF
MPAAGEAPSAPSVDKNRAATVQPVSAEFGRPSRRWLVVTSVGLLAVLLGTGAMVAARRHAATKTHVPNPEALRAFQRARFGDNAGRVQIQAGIRGYQEAIRLDPEFAAAWSGLATAHIAMSWFAEAPAKETMTQAKSEAHRALELDPSSAGALRVLGIVSHYLDWDQANAEKYYRRAIELRPKDTVVLSWFADYLLDLRRFDDALLMANRAQDAAPRWLEPMVVAGNVHAFSGRVDLAIAEYERALAIEPSQGLANHFLGRAYVAKGDRARGIEQLRKSTQLLGNVPFSEADLAYALAVGGQRADAERMLEEMLHKREQGDYPAFALAEIHMGLGRVDTALEWLDRAADERHMGFYLPSVDPVYEPLRSNPRFIALMKRMDVMP